MIVAGQPRTEVTPLWYRCQHIDDILIFIGCLNECVDRTRPHNWTVRVASRRFYLQCFDEMGNNYHARLWHCIFAGLRYFYVDLEALDFYGFIQESRWCKSSPYKHVTYFEIDKLVLQFIIYKSRTTQWCRVIILV